MTRVEAKNVNVWFGDSHVLRNINMFFIPGTITALIGPSGSGKSTFLRLFNRMNDMITDFRFDGLISIDGQDIYSREVRPDDIRKTTGMVFQKPNPFPRSVFENVAFGLRIHGTNKRQLLEEVVEKSLKQVSLWDEVKDRLKKNALTLSAGQQQRLCIARALAVEPKLILMDEPASALDLISTAKIEELILELKKSYTIIIVTHNLQQAGRISDYTAFIQQGELVEHDRTQKIFLNPAQARTQNYLTGRFG